MDIWKSSITLVHYTPGRSVSHSTLAERARPTELGLW